MKTKLLTALIVALSSLVISKLAHAQTLIDQSASDPLTGKWLLCQDKDNSPQDYLEFFDEGYGFVVRQDKPKTPFLFKRAAEDLLLAANSRGDLINIYMKVDSATTRLTLTSERTGNTALYVRPGQLAASECTYNWP